MGATIAFEATPVQCKLMDEITGGTNRIIGFGGGIRGTKTWGSLAALIALCKIFPNSRWAVVRKTLQLLRDTTIPSFEKLAPLTGGFVGRINQQDWEAECTNGSRILFRGENIDRDPTLGRFHGYEVNGFLAEEADELSERTFIKMIERAGTWIVPNGGTQPLPYVLCTFNPSGAWPKRRFYLPWRNGTLKPPYAFIPTTAADNPYIAPEQREAWKEMPEHEYKRFVDGDWSSVTGGYYDTLDAAVHMLDRAKLPRILPSYWKFWGSFDWGYKHWAVFGFWCTDTDGTDYLLDSVWLRKAQDDELAMAYLDAAAQLDPANADQYRRCLKAVYAGHDCWNKVVAHGASGESTADVFLKRGISLERADIDPVNSGRAVNRQLKVKDGRAGVYLVNTAGNARVYDQLAEILPDENDIRKPDKSSGRFDADEHGQGGDDGADMFRYGVATRISAAQLGREYDAKNDRPHADPNVSLVTTDGKPPVWIGPEGREQHDYTGGYASQLPGGL